MNNNDSDTDSSVSNGNGNVKVEVNGDISNVKLNGEVNANETNTKTEIETSNLLQSFATFCVSVLLKPTIVIIGDGDGDSVEDDNDNVINDEKCQNENHHVDHHADHHHHHHTTIYEQRICESIEEVANAYINGDDTDIPIETLFKLLMKIQGNTNTKDDKLIDDGDDDDDPLLLPSSSTSISTYRRTDLELFTNDIEDCLENTLLHEYLSANWDRIDDLIRVNEHQQKQKQSNRSDSKNKGNGTATPTNNTNTNEQQLEQEKDQNGFFWEKARKSYFRNKIMNDVQLKNIRKFSTMATILRSVQQEQEEEELKEEEEELEQKHGTSRSSSTSTTKSNSTNQNDSANDDIFFPHQQRHPTVYFLGGGMGAGKSSVVAYLKEQHDEMFTNNPVVVEADAFKHSDPIFEALNAFNNQNKEHHNDNEQQQTRKKQQPVRVSELVHEHSTDAANQQLVVALANQRDIVVDGTMTWLPYVQQTIAMVRDAHKHRYLLGPGYNNSNKKLITKKETATETVIDEQYWIQVEPIDEDRLFLPYRVEMVGVTIDPEYAVSRGIRRAIITGRGVPIRGQLRSHRLYSENFPIYCNKTTNNNKCLFDRIRLFDNSTTATTTTTTTKTSTINDDDTSATIQNNQQQHQRQRQRPPPRCIAWKESMDQPLSVIPDAYAHFLKKQRVNDNAIGVANLYNTSIHTNVDSDSNTNDTEAIEEKEGSSLALPLSQNSLTYVPSNIVIQWRLREVFSMANRK